uniref:Uncharacterized protein n=1 Tax=Arundo donax TaxID=35708 RepID=A0A0A9C975_ARUDO
MPLTTSSKFVRYHVLSLKVHFPY